MTDREKFVELLGECVCYEYDSVFDNDKVCLEKTADLLLDRGVTVQEWDASEEDEG